MARTLNYARSATPRRSKPIAILSFVGAALPLLIAAAVYGEWLLAWSALGHPPRPSLDDPKDIVGSNWMHGITGLALIGAVPGAMAALGLNAAHFSINRPSPLRVGMRVIALLLLWGALFVVFQADPGRVLFWWWD